MPLRIYGKFRSDPISNEKVEYMDGKSKKKSKKGYNIGRFWAEEICQEYRKIEAEEKDREIRIKRAKGRIANKQEYNLQDLKKLEYGRKNPEKEEIYEMKKKGGE